MYLFFQRTATTTENNTNKTTPKINPMIREKLESPILRAAWIVAPVEKNRNEFKYFCNLKQFQGLNYFSSEKITRREDSRFLTQIFALSREFSEMSFPICSAAAPAGCPNKNSNNRKTESARRTKGRGKRQPRFLSSPTHRAPRAFCFPSPQPPYDTKETSAEEKAPQLN